MRNFTVISIASAVLLMLASNSMATAQTATPRDNPTTVLHSGEALDLNVKKWRGVAACGDHVYELTAKFQVTSQGIEGEWNGSYYNPRRIPGYRYRNGPFIGSSPPFGTLPMTYNTSLGLLQITTRRGTWIGSVIGSVDKMAFAPQGRLAQYCSDLILYADRKARNQVKKTAEVLERLRVERSSGQTAMDYLKLEAQAVHVRTVSALMGSKPEPNSNPFNRRAINHLDARLDPRLRQIVSNWDAQLEQSKDAERRVEVERRQREAAARAPDIRAAKSPTDLDRNMQALMGCGGLIPIVRDSFANNPQLAFLRMPPEAFETLGACAGANNAEANYYLGANSAFGYLYPANLGQARRELSKSLELGNAQAGFLLLFLIGENEELQKPRYVIETVNLLEGLGEATPALIAQRNEIQTLQNTQVDLAGQMSGLRRAIEASEAKISSICSENPDLSRCQNR